MSHAPSDPQHVSDCDGTSREPYGMHSPERIMRQDCKAEELVEEDGGEILILQSWLQASCYV
eukprot:2085756-Pleurochrysis_carterae.AAC.2